VVIVVSAVYYYFGVPLIYYFLGLRTIQTTTVTPGTLPSPGSAPDTSGAGSVSVVRVGSSESNFIPVVLTGCLVFFLLKTMFTPKQAAQKPQLATVTVLD
jgi:hypothetical protein